MTGTPFARVLIANRGEIALRIIRACRELGVSPVAVYGDGEERALHVRAADDAYRIPPGGSLPYLDGDALVAIAKRAGAEAVHPGYGFLAENADFVDACLSAGLTFIGPSSAAMRSLGDKVAARRVALRAAVPITPGSDGPIASVDEARAWAAVNGYPVAVKAAGGGGGRGFRVAHREEELADAFAGASGEAQRYFANATVYLERYLSRPRHVEVQIFGDAFGSVVALGERDCSVQRRHQKLIEETPSPAVTEAVRADLLAAAVALGRTVGYVGAGTCEFMHLDDGSFYFLEMNTRIQVEHTITEEVTGIDLVKEQVLVAAGASLTFTQETLRPRGHAIQCRINAEDPARDFKPVAGVITRLRLPDGFGVRVDSALEEGGEILPAYDSMIAKLVATGRDRPEAIARMRRALGECVVEGVPTTIGFHRRVMSHPVFVGEGATTAFLTEHPEVIGTERMDADAAGSERTERSELVVEVDNRRFTVRMSAGLALNGSTQDLGAKTRALPARRTARSGGGGGGGGGRDLKSPIQGTVIRVAVEVGQVVGAGDLVCVIEAMKMENEVAAHRAGTVAAINVHPGEAVKIGTDLATIES